MRYYLPALAVMAATTFSVPAAHSVPITFTTSLSGANEVPAVVTPGAGFATVFLDPTANTLQVNVTFGNLTSPTDYSVTHPLLCATRHERHSRHHDTHVPRFPVRGDRSGLRIPSLRSHDVFELQSGFHHRQRRDPFDGRGGPDRGNAGRTKLPQYSHYGQPQRRNSRSAARRCPRTHRRCGASRLNCGLRCSSRLGATTAAEDRLSIRCLPTTLISTAPTATNTPAAIICPSTFTIMWPTSMSR